jgi:hypothetical protein
MTKVTEDQFEWSGDKLVHVPTGASFVLGSEFINYGRAGDVLADGRDFDRGDVRQVAHSLMVRRRTGG